MGECEHCGAREMLRAGQVSWHCSYCNAFNRLDLSGPTPEAGYQSLHRETAGERLGASKGDEADG